MADFGLTNTTHLMYNNVSYCVGYGGSGTKIARASSSGKLLPFLDGSFSRLISEIGIDADCGFDVDSSGDLYVDVSVDDEGGFTRYKSQDLGETWELVIEG